MQKFPFSVKNLFWDVDVELLDVQKHKCFIIERVLEKGSFTSVNWLLKNYKLKEISDIISNTSNLSAPTITFWRQLI
jgi:hypothetical protein